MRKNLILIVSIRDERPSGVSRYIDVLYSELVTNAKDNSDFDVKFLTFYTDSVAFVNRRDVVSEISIPFFQGVNTFKRSLDEVYEYFSNIKIVLSPYIDNYSRIILHTNEMCFVYLGDLLRKSYNIEVLFQQHVIPWKFSYEYDEATFNRINESYIKGEYKDIQTNKLEKDAYNLADKVIVVTKMAQSYVSTVFGVAQDKIVVIYNGIADIYSRLRKNFSDDLLFVGRMSKEKGFHFLIEALVYLSKRGIFPRLIAVGEDYIPDWVNRAISENSLNVDFMGKLGYKELVEVYKRGPIGIIPSIHEQCSYTAIEMSMFGLPIINTEVDGLCEIFDNNASLSIPVEFDRFTGIHVSSKIFADSILAFLNNRSLKCKHSVLVRQRFLQEFTSFKMINKLLNFYTTCL
ncbi:MAG: glycosyltransferase [Bacteroides sp.]|nr:glycosyltransferase [Bacteroides sp.]